MSNEERQRVAASNLREIVRRFNAQAAEVTKLGMTVRVDILHTQTMEQAEPTPILNVRVLVDA